MYCVCVLGIMLVDRVWSDILSILRVCTLGIMLVDRVWSDVLGVLCVCVGLMWSDILGILCVYIVWSDVLLCPTPEGCGGGGGCRQPVSGS